MNVPRDRNGEYEPQVMKKHQNIIGEDESAKFWLSKLNELKSRGVEDILIACVDGLTGVVNAIILKLKFNNA